MTSFTSCADVLFTSTEEQRPGMILGENGALEHSAESVGDDLVALFFALVRDAPIDRVKGLVDACLSTVDAGRLADLFVLCIQTRDCRGGKGERQLFYTMLLHLYEAFPSTVMQMLSLLGEFGYYKDFFQIGELVAGQPQFDAISRKIADLVANQLIADEEALDVGKSISMCAKYAPRQGSRFSSGKNKALFNDLVTKLYPAPTQSKKLYRQLISRLTKALDVPEVKMCGKRYAELNFSKVPSLCTKRCAKAFLNEKLQEAPTADEDLTGNRHPDDADRVACRQNLRLAALDSKINGAQLYPHEIVKTLYEAGSGARGKQCGSLEKQVLDAQWKCLRTNLLDQLAATQSEGKGKPVDLGRLVPLSDVSGSMEGIPMLVSIALGILVSEVNHPAFRDRVLSFDSNPSWINLTGLGSIAQKVDVMRQAPWGGSTNIQKAFELICAVVREHRLPIHEVPDLLIFSDMQFDCAAEERGGQRQTQLEAVRAMFHKVGMEVCGVPYPAPKIIFWNLRGSTVGYPAAADDSNVQMLSGFSSALLKYVLEGGEEEVEEEEEVVDPDTGAVSVVKVKATASPYQTLRKVLDGERYHAVRTLLSRSAEGLLGEYSFEPPAPISGDDAGSTMEV
ncbi:hypothetical protein B484DRAFT_451289 [Ochromonadaceae sp. CCMP2298]|nr:hypothetical protein B484DRAFT_451289 [Ochromonadaceae sp. CCMP2298]|mmetsp:Transcript_30414/g.67980  ORF Transcript_30414/g.67980 Transcript_30414/m.67980 type:complete len:623 (-) Transcript_30414:117-1985(-)